MTTNKCSVEKTDLPRKSGLSYFQHYAYYSDSFSFQNNRKDRSAMQIWLEHSVNAPSWLNRLMIVRNRLLSLVGLKNLGLIGDIDLDKTADHYKVGDRVGMFTLLSIKENEIILGDNDKHLGVNVSVYIDGDRDKQVFISTVVHVHNVFGKLYMFFVKPVHQRIVPATIIRAESFSATAQIVV